MKALKVTATSLANMTMETLLDIQLEQANYIAEGRHLMEWANKEIQLERPNDSYLCRVANKTKFEIRTKMDSIYLELYPDGSYAFTSPLTDTPRFELSDEGKYVDYSMHCSKRKSEFVLTTEVADEILDTVPMTEMMASYNLIDAEMTARYQFVFGHLS